MHYFQNLCRNIITLINSCRTSSHYINNYLYLQDLNDKSLYHIDMGFWKKVGEELEFRGMSRKELSAMSGVPMTTMNRAIERDSNPFAHDAIRIANTLGLPVETLLEIPQSAAVTEENGRQIALYRKYQHIINTLESLPRAKQHLASEILERCAALAAERTP